MIGFRVDQAKALFFDKTAVLGATTRAERKNLSKFGAFVRTRARRSIRSRKGVSSPSGPPSSHTGKLKDFLFFVYEPNRHSVVIGPAKLNSVVGNAPEALEHGGESVMLFGPRGKRVERKVTIRARPSTTPAFEEEKKNLGKIWENSVR